MKKLLILIVVIISLLNCFTACSKEGNEFDEKTNFVDTICGTRSNTPPPDWFFEQQ